MTSEVKPRAVALVVHGLNLLPERMSAIAKVLQDCHIEVFKVTLTGHSKNPSHETTPSREIWLKEFSQIYELASQRAQELNIPIYLVGYSLGALIGVEAALENPKIQYQKMLLLAPAFTPRFPVRLIDYVLGKVPEFFIPSSAPENYRVSSRLSSRVYKALFESVQNVKDKDFSSLNIPTLVFADPKDELVSEKALRELLDSKKVLLWQLESVSAKNAELSPPIHHLIIDQMSLGLEEWTRMKSLIQKFFI